MAEVTDAEMLVLVRNSIQAVLKGQEFRLGDKWLTRADLGMLNNMEKDYQRRVNQSGGSVITGITIDHG